MTHTLCPLARLLGRSGRTIFEIVWVYRCGLLFGNTVWATSIVLSSFMGDWRSATLWLLQRRGSIVIFGFTPHLN